MKKIGTIPLLTGSFSAVLLAFVFLYFNMIGLEPAYYRAFFTDIVSWAVIPQILVVSLLLAWVLKVRYAKSRELTRALAPAWLLYLLFVFPMAFLSILFFIFITMLCFWRIAAVCGWSFPSVVKKRTIPEFVCLGALLGCAWGIYMQLESFDRLWFTLTDWTEYYLGYLQIFSELRNGSGWRILYNAGHFNPLPNLLITPVLAVWPYPQTLFVLNSIFLYLTIPLWYYVARLHGMRRFPAGLLALLLMFHFTLPNLNLSLFYGFHPIAMFPALLLLFYIFYKKRNRVGTAVLFVLILLLQETTAVFWFGWGIYLFFRKRYWKGIGLSFFSCVWFAFIIRVVSPLTKQALKFPAGDVDQYVQTFHYNNIGRSVSDILLSPFTNPGLFFTQLASPLNLYFILTLLLAFFPLALSSWKILAAALPLLIGLFMMGGSDALNISMWYQTEIFSILILALACGYELLRKHPFPMPGLPKMKPGRIAVAAIYASALGLFLCGLFFGRLPYGKYSFSRIQERPDATETLNKIKNRIYSTKDLILTTPQIRMHFLPWYRTADIMKTKPPFKAPFVLLYLDDLHVDFERNQALFEYMRTNPDYELIYEHRQNGCTMELYLLKSRMQHPNAR